MTYDESIEAVVQDITQYLYHSGVLHILCAPPLSDNGGPNMVCIGSQSSVWVFVYLHKGATEQSMQRVREYRRYKAELGSASVISVAGTSGIQRCLTSRGITQHEESISRDHELSQYEDGLMSIFNDCSKSHGFCTDCSVLAQCQTYHANLGNDVNHPDNRPSLASVEYKLRMIYERSHQTKLALVFDDCRPAQKREPIYHCLKCGARRHSKKTNGGKCLLCGGEIGANKDEWLRTSDIARDMNVSVSTVMDWKYKGYILDACHNLNNGRNKNSYFTREAYEKFKTNLPELIASGAIRLSRPKAGKRNKRIAQSPLVKRLKAAQICNYRCQSCGATFNYYAYSIMRNKSTRKAVCTQCGDGLVVYKKGYMALRDVSIYTGVPVSTLKKLINAEAFPIKTVKTPRRVYYQFEQKILDDIKRWKSNQY